MSSKALVVIDIQNDITSYDLKKLPEMLAYYESKNRM